jgi:DNA-binding NtrC family response regulator
MNRFCKILILDDLFGRCSSDGPNEDRENLCAHFLWKDSTLDASAVASQLKVLQPTADAVFCRAQSPTCSVPGDTVENDLEMALEAVRQGWPARHAPPATCHSPTPWSMVLIDLCFYTGRVTEESHRHTPGMPEGRPSDDDPRSYFGLALLEAIHCEFPELPIFILSSKPRSQVSLEFSRLGALGFIDRSSLDGPELLQQALWTHGLLADPDGEVVGQSLPMLLALREARRAASHRENLLIRGERGSGKELIARYVSRCAAKRSENLPSAASAPSSALRLPSSAAGPPSSALRHPPSAISNLPALVTVNSAIFTPNLFTAELFGIEPKTATAVDGKIGLIEMAQGGDLFLDEIADMPPEVQAAMLRVLQERKITRVGGRRAIDVDVRFLSATNADLENPERGFRADLLDRLRIGGTVRVPPLRERREDIPLLAEKFVRDAEAMRPGIRRREISPDSLDLLREQDWPGNIRQLKSVLFEAVSRHPDVEHLVPAHLRLEETRSSTQAPKVTVPPPRTANGSGLDHMLELLDHCEFPAAEIGKWTGQLERLQLGQSRLVARYLQAAIEATKRRTPENPAGVVQIHPAAKLATGNPKLTATKAADLFKRHLSSLADSLEGDLREAYTTALRLRPKAAAAKKV